MIFCIIFLIIIITSWLVVCLKKMDEAVILYHRKFLGDIFAITEDIKEIRKSLHDVNNFIKFLSQKKLINTYKIIGKTLDIISVLFLFKPAKSKKALFKRFFSTKALKYAYSLYKTITA